MILSLLLTVAFYFYFSFTYFNYGKAFSHCTVRSKGTVGTA